VRSTAASIAYDTVLEETGDGDLFERTIGRVRFVASVGLVVSALAGGLLAEVVPLRATYFMTAPVIGLAVVALLRFREPRLHRAEEGEPLRQQVATTYRTLLERGAADHRPARAHGARLAGHARVRALVDG
jgi:hypothetical protein